MCLCLVRHALFGAARCAAQRYSVAHQLAICFVVARAGSTSVQLVDLLSARQGAEPDLNDVIWLFASFGAPVSSTFEANGFSGWRSCLDGLLYADPMKLKLRWAGLLLKSLVIKLLAVTYWFLHADHSC